VGPLGAREPEMKVRVLVAAAEFSLRARLTRVLQSSGYVAAFAHADRRDASSGHKLSAALVVPTTCDDAGLTLARELCAEGCRVIVLAPSREAVALLSRRLPDAHALLAQPLDEQRLVHLLAQITAGRGSEATTPTTVLRFEGRSLDLGGRALID